MHTNWESLHRFFELRARCADANAYEREAAAHAALDAFAEFADLVAYLLERPLDLDERDRIVACLVRLARVEATREVASALIWLTLWPGLCRIYHRVRRRGASEAEAVSAIGFALTTQILGLELARVGRVVATLVRNTEREAGQSLRHPVGETLIAEDLALARCYDPSEGLDRVWCTLQTVAGQDAELMLRVVVLEESHQEVADRLGISAAAARKRYQRSIERARAELTERVAA